MTTSPGDFSPVRITTPRLVLRDLRAGDLADLNVFDADPEVVRYMSCDVQDLEGTRAYLERSLQGARETPRKVYDLAITRPGEDRALGRVGLHVERPEHRDATVWFVVRRELWGQGLVTEAARALFAFAFDELKLHRLWADADPRNVGSWRVMEKLGMRREAHLRENWWLKGEWCDSYLYAILDREFTLR